MALDAKRVPRRRRRKSATSQARTLRDVAIAAGVSTASASRALTRPDLVSEDLKEEVERAARELGYVPNAAAQALSGHPRRLAGVVLGGLGDPVVMAVLDAMADQLAAHDVALLIATGAGTQVETSKRVRELMGRGAEVVLFGNGADPLRPVGEARMNHIPWAGLDVTDRDQGIDSAGGFDRARAYALAVRYLGNLGHRRVALLARGGDRHVAAAPAAMGKTDILLSHIKVDEPGVAGWLSFLRGTPGAPTALVCESDALAAATLTACGQQGIAVPGDLTIVGFGDSELARLTQPTLTTIRVPTRQAGLAAADYVVAVLEGRAVPATQLAVKLIARESSGAFRA